MKIEEYHNKHKGKPLFMVGNGKSLQVTPLEKMEFTMAMNNIALIYDERDWQPTFYWNATANTKLHSWWYEQAYKTMILGMPSFIGRNSILPSLFNVIRINYLYSDSNIPLWSLSANKYVFHYKMSIYGATQLACYMGFNPIYMVGCDANFSNNPDECHFNNKYEGGFEWTDELIAHDNYWSVRAHEIINSFTTASGVEVYNATIGGNLEVYPRVNIEDVL